MKDIYRVSIEQRLKELEFDKDNIDGVLVLLEGNFEWEKEMCTFLQNDKLTPHSRDAIFKYARYISDNWYLENID